MTVSRDASQVVEFVVPPVVGATQVAIFAFAPGAATPAWTWVGPPGRVRYGAPTDAEATLAEALGEAARARLATPESFAAVAFGAAGEVVATVPRRPL